MAVNLPNHPFLTQDTCLPNSPQRASDLSQKHETSSNKLSACKRKRIDQTASQIGEGLDPSPLSSITGHLNHRATIAHGEEYYPLHRPRSEAGDAVARHLTEPAANSPMARWKRESVEKEPWNSTSRLDAKDGERALEVHKRNTDLVSKDGNHVTPKTTPFSHWTSSKATEYCDGASEGGACADLAGVGTWLR
ncbi:hypothetical protein EPUS_06589 [Endocarpon pusillum Z07020]|uniref:Uncharacterized protein n=1 Tax=Endocarpon pusillum (strain Z07020 / HMAS-L-300199) TaxID=1263415 RepID=U1GR06_ENDPU|nr:uncharacterized protein EPUS_06589 [Endocarpon pusillum Z07020]ERF74411.1 hypothetical protein EPUS_06589 [Endocarpon pusillum Z07020]